LSSTIKKKETFAGRLGSLFFAGNVFIALCAGSMVLASRLMNGLPIAFTPLFFFLVLSTFTLYYFHRISYHPYYTGPGNLSRALRSLNFLNPGIIIVALAAVATLIAFFRLSANVSLMLIPPVLLSMLYSIPFLKIEGRKKPFREFLFIKVPLLSLVWSATTVMLPLAEEHILHYNSFVILQFISRFLFIFALCIPFEIRDIEFDRSKKVKTLAVVYGKRKLQIAGVVIILLEILTHHLMRVTGNMSVNSVIALDLSSLLALVWIIFSPDRNNLYFFKFLVDGTMFIRFIFLYLAVTT
jgi:4-hydroxybenzoate polyprenyltransferase